MTWTQEQYSQLSERYRDMSDAELRRLAKTPDDLTDRAMEVLNKEIAARGMHLAEGSGALSADGFTDSTGGDAAPERIDRELWMSYAQNAAEECTFYYLTERQARDAVAFLWENKIDSQLLTPRPDSVSLTGPRVVVLPEDAERAALILSQPIPEHIASEPDEDEVVVEEFVAPACPACGAPDPVLIAIEPHNRWLCEGCEHEWDEVESA